MLGLSPPRIFQCRNVKVLDEADSHRRSCRFYRPHLSRGGCFKPPKPLATALVRAAQHSRVASAPRRISWRESGSKSCVPTGPAEPFAITFAPPREWLRVKDHVPPETELHREGFKMLSSIQIQQTIYGLHEPPNVLWLAQKCVYASLTCHSFRERA